MSGLKDKKISDDILDDVIGGVRLGSANKDDSMRVTCNNCHEVFRRTNMTGRVICPFCNEEVDVAKKTGSIVNKVTV